MFQPLWDDVNPSYLRKSSKLAHREALHLSVCSVTLDIYSPVIHNICRRLSSIILNQTPNATRKGAQFNKSKFRGKALQIYYSQISSTNILKPFIFVCHLGFIEPCSDWSKHYYHDFRVFLKFYKSCNLAMISDK